MTAEVRMKVLGVADTPNPDALKFITDGRLVRDGARSFDGPAAGREDGLATALFAAAPVTSVFYMDRFVTVTKPPHLSWTEIQPAIVKAIETTAQSVPDEPAEVPAGDSTDDQLLQRINAVLDANVRPALAGDGGGLQVMEFKDYVLTVHYQGACGGCPSSTSGTLFAIQNLLQRLVDSRIQVLPV
jgi:Fe-S cluster biogenesis protein NfuA